MILETQRLHLRPVVETDVPNIQKYFAHWEIVKHLTPLAPWPYPNDGAMDFYQSCIKPNHGDGVYYFAINEKDNPNHLIGIIQLNFEFKEHVEEHVGFWLAIPFHRQGYMSEALLSVMAFGFNEWKMPEIQICSSANNPACFGLKESIGMKHVRREKCDPLNDGTAEHDVHIITRDEWLKLKKK